MALDGEEKGRWCDICENYQRKAEGRRKEGRFGTKNPRKRKNKFADYSEN
jgi:hypothetical protein